AGGGVHPVRRRRIARRGADLVELPRWNRVRGPGGRAPVARALGAAGRVDRQRGNRTRMIPTRRARLAATIAVVVLAILPYAVAGRISLSIFVFIGLFSLIVIGLSLLAGHAGQVSLGQAAFYGLGAYIAAISPLLIAGARASSYLIWAFVFAALWLGRNLVSSRVGRALAAVRSSEVGAATVGINPAFYKSRVFAASAALAGLAGALYVHYLSFV